MTGWSLGDARIILDVAVGTTVGVSRASRVSIGTKVGVEKLAVDVEAGIGVERGVAVGSCTDKLQDVKINTTIKIPYLRPILPPQDLSYSGSWLFAIVPLGQTSNLTNMIK
ncbi:hypothetical protein E2P64_07120 [Candidatus Bathyarchaeota archaeon]|nr:hypothetical protein E2P64_07120 [Candidatus Bathyarchaeota archaeon]